MAAGYIDPFGNDIYGGLTVDDAATPNTGAGPRTYDDRGAYEMRNLGFEANTDLWSASGSSPGVTLSHVASGHTGAGAALLTNTGSDPANCALTASPNLVRNTDAGTYTGTLWVRADAPASRLTLRLRERLWTAPFTKLGEATATVRLTSQWQPVTVQYTVVDPVIAGDAGSALEFSAFVTGAASGTCFYADDASVFVG